jgi:hypothetical protein
MTESNVVITSNVYVRESVPLKDDLRFIAQVRGRVAIRKLLERLAPGQDAKSAARRFLSLRQIAESAWQSPCVCGAFPEGPVTVGGEIDVKFRCPSKTCDSANFRTRFCLLDVELVHQVTAAFGRDIRDIIQMAISRPHLQIPEVPTCERRPITVRLSLFQDVVLTDEAIETSLRCLLIEAHDARR